MVNIVYNEKKYVIIKIGGSVSWKEYFVMILIAKKNNPPFKRMLIKIIIMIIISFILLVEGAI